MKFDIQARMAKRSGPEESRWGKSEPAVAVRAVPQRPEPAAMQKTPDIVRDAQHRARQRARILLAPWMLPLWVSEWQYRTWLRMRTVLFEEWAKTVSR
jgi:hypothetical protein